jgi:hypothetical protein
MAQLTKSDVAGYFRTVQADTGRAAVIRGAAKIAADGIETSKVDKMLRELQGIIDNVSNANTTVVAAILVAAALTTVGSPDLPAVDE